MSIHDINTQSQEKISLELTEAHKKKRKVFYFKHRLASGEIKDVEVFSGAISIDDTPLLLSFVQDITELNRLRGILSICSHCKKIRNKKGGWTEIEIFIGSKRLSCYKIILISVDLLPKRNSFIIQHNSLPDNTHQCSI